MRNACVEMPLRERSAAKSMAGGKVTTPAMSLSTCGGNETVQKLESAPSAELGWRPSAELERRPSGRT